MPLPALDNWESTSNTLHQVAMLTGPIRNALFEHCNNYLELPMQVTRSGFSTGKLPQGGELSINLKEAEVIFQRPDGSTVQWVLAGLNQKELFSNILHEMRQSELHDFMSDIDIVDNTIVKDFMEKLINDPDKHEFLKVEDVSHTDTFNFNPQTASDYADAMYAIFTGIARFRARLEGAMTPLVVWAEHFDLSGLWFPSSNREMDANQAHMNFGFSPFSPGIPRPYLYVYAYPYPETYDAPTLPENVKWETEAYTGPFLAYDDIAKKDNPEQYVEDVCMAIFEAMLPLLK